MCLDNKKIHDTIIYQSFLAARGIDVRELSWNLTGANPSEVRLELCAHLFGLLQRHAVGTVD